MEGAEGTREWMAREQRRGRRRGVLLRRDTKLANAHCPPQPTTQMHDRVTGEAGHADDVAAAEERVVLRKVLALVLAAGRWWRWRW